MPIQTGLAPWFGSFILLALLVAGQSTISSLFSAPLSKGKLWDSLSSFRGQVLIDWHSFTGLRTFHHLPVGANSSGDLLVVSNLSALYPYQLADLVWFTLSLDGLLSGKGWCLLVVLWTDFFQGLVLLAILTIFLPRIAQSDLVMNSSQQLSHFAETLDGKMVFILVAGAGFSSLFSYVSSQDIVQHFNSKMGRRKIGKILWLQGLLSFGIASLLYLIGTFV